MNKFCLFFLLLSFSFTCLQAQDREISGTITSSDEELPLPGVSILIVGTLTGTVTDIEGNYKLSLPSGATLRFSYIGYRSQDILVGNQSVIDVLMIPDVSRLQEVVVTSLGLTRDRMALNYSVSEVSG